MRIFFLVFFTILSNFVSAKKDDIPEYQIHLYDNLSNNSDICTINTSKGNFSFKVSDSNDFKNSLLINSLDLQEQLVVKAIIKECICRTIYQMTGKEKEKFLSSDYQDIIRLLLRLEGVSDQNIWKLWEEYKQRHTFRFGSNKKYEEELRTGLTKRKKERDKQALEKKRKEQANNKKIAADELQRKQAFLRKYNQNILDASPHSGLDPESSFISSCHQQRQQALEQTISDGGKHYVKNHAVDIQTQAFMQIEGIDNHQFKALSGTVFSHQLFQECADHYQKVAKIFFKYGLKNSTLIPHIINCTQAAFEGTKYEQFSLAIQLSDIAEILADFSVGVWKGVIEKACNFIDLFRHPKQLVVAAEHLAASLIRITQTLGGALAVYDQEGVVGVTSLHACQQSFGDDVLLFNQMSDLSRGQFSEWYQKSSLQDKGQVISGMVIDFTVTPFILGKAMKACGVILVEAKNALKFERAIELAEELGVGFQEAEELLVATEAGMQKLPASAVEIEIAMTSFMESEGLLIEIQNEVISVVEEITGVQKISAKIEYINKEISSCSINAQDALHRKMKALENIMDEVVKIRKLADGRVRYYTKEALAKTTGPTRGSCFVMEHNPDTN